MTEPVPFFREDDATVEGQKWMAYCSHLGPKEEARQSRHDHFKVRGALIAMLADGSLTYELYSPNKMSLHGCCLQFPLCGVFVVCPRSVHCLDEDRAACKWVGLLQ